MNILEINSCNYGSTGKIMLQIANTAKESGNKVLICIPRSRENERKKIDSCLYIGGRISRNVHLIMSRITGLNGCFSIIPTFLFLRKVSEFSPEIIHLHNLHNSYINLPMLFWYIKKNNIKTIWTLHDCWSFTGKCPYFTMAKCEKWKNGCYDCPQLNAYPASKIDITKIMWRLKRKWFTGVANMTIVTPSEWLAGLVRQSYLRDYPVEVINNGIDLSVFKPVESDFRKKHHLKDKYVLLGIAFDWGKRKGLDIFIELSQRLDERFRIVLVGTNDDIDKHLPKNIISVHKTQNQQELAEIYSSADLFVNPTREENYPTVNMESIACGTPVLTFRTGGSPEIPDDKTGCIVDANDIEELERKIVQLCTDRVFKIDDFFKRAASFNKDVKFSEYVSLYTS